MVESISVHPVHFFLLLWLVAAAAAVLTEMIYQMPKGIDFSRYWTEDDEIYYSVVVNTIQYIRAIRFLQLNYN